MRLPSGLTSRLIQVPERTSSGISRRSPGGVTSQTVFEGVGRSRRGAQQKYGKRQGRSHADPLMVL